ncbi:hypothetical protein HanPI659440_Chr10g0381041 [Helianthus annuus]|nr:hypothetical protein HanPI659440_Chr10g0381041 [Helianthus annuus]
MNNNKQQTVAIYSMEITLIYHPLHCSPIFTSSRAHTRYKLSPKILLKFASILVQNKARTPPT